MPKKSPSPRVRIPSYRRHKATGQAVVTLDRDYYLGPYNSAKSRLEYNRLIAEWTAAGGTMPKQAQSDFEVAELLAAFWTHAKSYYRRPDGRPSKEQHHYKVTIRRVRALYGPTPAVSFGPLALKAIRQGMIDDDLARKTINQTVNRIRHIFKWATENELIPATVLHGLQAVDPLKRGRSDARETAAVKPVPDAFVDAVLPHVSRQVAAIIELQRVTGMRSGEAIIMRGCDLNTTGKVWEYVPESHKTAHLGHERRVYLGPKAQAIIKPFLKADTAAYLFSPADAEADRRAEGHRLRITPLSCGNKPGSNRTKKPKRLPGARYDSGSYRRAITRGVEAENRRRLKEAAEQGIDPKHVELVPDWHPHQLRHNAATSLRREFGIEVARVILGHRSAAVTEIYAEVDNARAAEVMGRIG